MKNKLIIAVALLLLLSGCSIVSVGYNYADVYLRYTINSYASFNDVQKEIIRNEVNIYMRWHRKNMLPEYVVFLQELRGLVQSGKVLKQEDVARVRSEARSLYVKTMQPTVIPAATILKSVDSRQIKELVQSFAKKNAKLKDKELSGDQQEQLRKRAEKTIDFMENVVGDLTDSQLELIRNKRYKLPLAASIYIRLREDNQARLIALMTQNSAETDIAKFLSQWILMPAKYIGSDEQLVLQEFEQASDEMIAGIYAILNERQKNKLLKNVVKYIDVFQELSRQQ